jgi:hypothetical protein
LAFAAEKTRDREAAAASSVIWFAPTSPTSANCRAQMGSASPSPRKTSSTRAIDFGHRHPPPAAENILRMTSRLFEALVNEKGREYAI